MYVCMFVWIYTCVDLQVGVRCVEEEATEHPVGGGLQAFRDTLWILRSGMSRYDAIGSMYAVQNNLMFTSHYHIILLLIMFYKNLHLVHETFWRSTHRIREKWNKGIPEAVYSNSSSNRTHGLLPWLFWNHAIILYNYFNFVHHDVDWYEKVAISWKESSGRARKGNVVIWHIFLLITWIWLYGVDAKSIYGVG